MDFQSYFDSLTLFNADNPEYLNALLDQQSKEIKLIHQIITDIFSFVMKYSVDPTLYFKLLTTQNFRHTMQEEFASLNSRLTAMSSILAEVRRKQYIEDLKRGLHATINKLTCDIESQGAVSEYFKQDIIALSNSQSEYLFKYIECLTQRPLPEIEKFALKKQVIEITKSMEARIEVIENELTQTIAGLFLSPKLLSINELDSTSHSFSSIKEDEKSSELRECYRQQLDFEPEMLEASEVTIGRGSGITMGSFNAKVIVLLGNYRGHPVAIKRFEKISSVRKIFAYFFLHKN